MAEAKSYTPLDVELKQFPWFRLFMLAIGSMLCAGMMPGTALYIDLLAEAGVFGSVCPAPNATKDETEATLRLLKGEDSEEELEDEEVKDDEKEVKEKVKDEDEESDKKKEAKDGEKEESQKSKKTQAAKKKVKVIDDKEDKKEKKGKWEPCQEQFMALTDLFSTGSFATLLGQIPVGVFFDMYGTWKMSFYGGLMVLIGQLLLAIVIWGGENGMDASTNGLFPVAFFMVDFFAFVNSYGINGLMFHFPGRVTFVLSVSMATYQLSSFQPLMVQAIMSLGLPLWVSFIIFNIAVAIGVVICYVYAPTQAEYYKAAKVAMGVPLPDPPKAFACWTPFKDANKIMWQQCTMHTWCIFGFGSVMGFGFMFQGMIADYGHALLGSEEDGQKLAMSFVFFTAVIGGLIVPPGILFLERFGIRTVLGVGYGITVIGLATFWIPNWAGQYICASGIASFMSFFGTGVQKYATLYATSNRFGVFISTLIFYMSLWAMFVFATMSSLTTSFEGLDAFRYPFAMGAVLGIVLYGIFTVRFLVKGPPEVPYVTPEDEKELAGQFELEDLDQVCYVMDFKEKGDFFKILADPDPEVAKSLATRINQKRMAEMTEKNQAAKAGGASA